MRISTARAIMKTGIAQQTHVKTASLSKNLNTRPTEIAVRIIVLPTIQLDPPLRFDQLGTFAIPATNLEKINPANAKAREIANAHPVIEVMYNVVRNSSSGDCKNPRCRRRKKPVLPRRTAKNKLSDGIAQR